MCVVRTAQWNTTSAAQVAPENPENGGGRTPVSGVAANVRKVPKQRLLCSCE